LRWGVQSFQRNSLIRLVLERLVVVVDALLVDPPISFDRTDDMPALRQAQQAVAADRI